MFGSSKYPYPHHGGNWKFWLGGVGVGGGGGVNDAENSRGEERGLAFSSGIYCAIHSCIDNREVAK